MTLNVTPFPTSATQHRSTGADHAVENHVERSTGCAATARTFHFWRGASNRRYVHIVHSIFDCPDIEASNYVLARVDAAGVRTPLRISRTTSAHGFENLAEIRFHAARLGATEVHLHVVAETQHAQAMTQWDLAAAYFGGLTEEGAFDAEKTSINA